MRSSSRAPRPSASAVQSAIDNACSAGDQHFHQLPAHQREIGDGPAERGATAGGGQRLVHAAAHHGGGAHAVRQARKVHLLHHLLQARVLAGQRGRLPRPPAGFRRWPWIWCRACPSGGRSGRRCGRRPGCGAARRTARGPWCRQARLRAGPASARRRRRCGSRTISRRAAASTSSCWRAMVSIAPTSDPPAFSVMNWVPFHIVDRSADSILGSR